MIEFTPAESGVAHYDQAVLIIDQLQRVMDPRLDQFMIEGGTPGIEAIERTAVEQNSIMI